MFCNESCTAGLLNNVRVTIADYDVTNSISSPARFNEEGCMIVPHDRLPWNNPHRLIAQDTFRIVAPPTEIHRKWRQVVVSCHPKETQHCCQVTSVVFTDASSDSTNAGHHLLCAQYWRQCYVSCGVKMVEIWLQPQRADRHYVPPPILLCDVEGFDQNCLRRGRRQEHRDWGHHDRGMAWRATVSKLVLYAQSTSAVISGRETKSVYFILCIDRPGW